MNQAFLNPFQEIITLYYKGNILACAYFDSNTMHTNFVPECTWDRLY